MIRRLVALVGVLLCSHVALGQTAPSLVKDVRVALTRDDFPAAEQLVAADRSSHGITPENLEAGSWLGRGALAAKRYDQAEDYAQRTYDLAVAELKRRPIDQDPRLPIALGAAIEVMAQVAAARGQRTEAVSFLRANSRATGTPHCTSASRRTSTC